MKFLHLSLENQSTRKKKRDETEAASVGCSAGRATPTGVSGRHGRLRSQAASPGAACGP